LKAGGKKGDKTTTKTGVGLMKPLRALLFFQLFSSPFFFWSFVLPYSLLLLLLLYLILNLFFFFSGFSNVGCALLMALSGPCLSLRGSPYPHLCFKTVDYDI